MSDHHHDDYLRTGKRGFRLTADIALLMGKGAGYALATVLAVGVAYWLLVILAGVLPERSKEALDPTPDSSFLIDAGPVPMRLI
jgi:hypothetical protein